MLQLNRTHPLDLKRPADLIKKRGLRRAAWTAVVLGAALALTGCWNTREGGNRYQLMYRSERERVFMPDTVGSQAASPTGGPTEDQGKPAGQGGARSGIIR